MGQLSSINGCGVRSCDSLWEKYTNVSRGFCFFVRVEEVSHHIVNGKGNLSRGIKGVSALANSP